MTIVDLACRAAVLVLDPDGCGTLLQKARFVDNEDGLGGTVRGLIAAFNGFVGKVIADLIAEGQSEPAVLKDLYDRHIAQRRAETVAVVERGMAAGEFVAATDPNVLIDTIFGALYYRLLLRSAPLTEAFGEKVVDQVLCGVRQDA